MNTNSNLKYTILVILLLGSIFLNAENPRINMLKSAVLPGWGQLSLKNNSGYIFLATETIFWSAKLYLSNEENLKEDEAFLYAVKYAHIDPTLDYDEIYFDYLGKRDNPDIEPYKDYEDYILNKAEQLYPNDEQQQIEYIQKYSWDWDEDKRSGYISTRSEMVKYSDYAKIFTGTIIANHIISAINASILSTKINKRLRVNVQLDKKLNPSLACEYKF